MENEIKAKSILPDFIDTFCIRIDKLPSSDLSKIPKYRLMSTDVLKEEMTYTYHEGYLNFNINGVSYLTCDCPDVRAYLESLGYQESRSEKRTVLAPWYNVNLMSIIYSVDDPVFRKFLALTYINLDHGPNNDLNSSVENNYCHTFHNRKNGTIGSTEEEITKTISRMKQEETIFNDDLWLKSSWRTYLQEQKDELMFNLAYKYLQSKVHALQFDNVWLGKRLNAEDRTKVINYWLVSNGAQGNYTLSLPYVEAIRAKCQEDGGFQSLYNVSKPTQRDILLALTHSICKSPEQLEEALLELLPSKTVSGHELFTQELRAAQNTTVPTPATLPSTPDASLSSKSTPNELDEPGS